MTARQATHHRAAVRVVLALVVVGGLSVAGWFRLRGVARRLLNGPRGAKELTLYDERRKAVAQAQPLQFARFVPGDQASHMRAEDAVIGLRAKGKTWALPWWVMKNHHVANLDLDGEPTLVTFCERCTGAAVFDPTVDGKRLHFRPGGTYRGTPLLIDDETGTYWDIFAGDAFRGRLVGTKLTQRPVVQSVWRDWLAANPLTLVADGQGEPRGGHGSKDYPGDPIAGRGLGDTILRLDDRLPPATMVLGVWAGSRARCYPFAELDARGGVIADSFEGKPIVAIKRPDSFEALVFESRTEGRPVALRFDGASLVDATTGSRFTTLGEALDGPLAGETLRYVTSGVEEFNTWAAHHPGAEIFGWTPEKATAAAAATRMTPVPARDDGHE